MTLRSAATTRLAHLLAVAVVAAGGLLAGRAQADEYLDRANRAAAATSGTKPAEDVLFPAILGMDPPPIRVGFSRDALRELLILDEDDAQWRALARWSQREPQRKALEALATVGDVDELYILGIPYGEEGVDPEWVEAGLCVQLGPDGLLYGSRFRYLDRLSWMAGLGLFESARLASEGEGEEALSVLGDCLRLARIIAERAFLEEKSAAIGLAFVVLERVRDVAFSYPDAFTSTVLSEASRELEYRVVKADRIPLPQANKLAAEQIVARAFEYRGEAKPDELASLMAAAETGERPLRLFAVSAWWEERARAHADWFDTTDQITAVWKDYGLRWALEPHDEILERPSDFRKMDPADYPVVYVTMKGIEALFDAREKFVVELGGTYNGLGVMAFKLKEKSFPPQIASIDPNYVKQRVKDPYYADLRFDPPVYKDFPYWVPMRDYPIFSRREDPHPYEITVVTAAGAIEDLGAAPAQPALPFDPSMLADDDVDFSDFPTEIFDTEAFRITDVDRLREYLIEKTREQDIDPGDLRELNQMISRFGAPGGGSMLDEMGSLPREELRDALARGIDAGLDSDETRAAFQAFGIDRDQLRSLLVDLFADVLSNQTYVNGLKAMSEGGEVTEAQLREMSDAVINTVITDRYVNGALDILRRPVEMMGGIDAILAASGPAESFTAALDDTYFMLYSVGENGKDDRGAVVGIAGTGADDILIWPAAITLEREFNR